MNVEVDVERRDKLQRQIDKAARYERLKQYDSFMMYIEDLKENQRKIDEQLHDYRSGVKMGMEKNYLRLIESQVGYHIFDYVINKVDEEINAGRKAQYELSQLLQEKETSL